MGCKWQTEFILGHLRGCFPPIISTANAQTADNQDLSGGITGDASGAFVRDNIVAVIDQSSGSRAIRFWNSSFTRQATSDFDLNSSSDSYQGLGITDTRILVLNSTQNRIEFYTHSGTYQSSENISLPSNSWTGMIVTDDRILVTRYVSNTTTYIDFYTHAGVEQADEQIEVDPNGVYHALGITDDRYYIVHQSNRRAYAYDFSRSRQSSDDITGLPTDTAASFTTFEPADATITLSTTDTDIRAGDTVTIDIDSTIDITLTASDITVTGGTRGTLTGSGQDYALSVTAGDAGTLTVSIAEDAVPEGNAAVSEDFTITANYQLHIADGSNDNISVIGYDTADSDTADALRTYTTTDSTDVQSIVYDGTHIHVTNWQQSTVRVYAINLSGVSPVVRSYTVSRHITAVWYGV